MRHRERARSDRRGRLRRRGGRGRRVRRRLGRHRSRSRRGRCRGATFARAHRTAELGAAAALKARTTTERPDAETWALAPALLAALAAVGLAAVPLTPGLLAADVANGIVLFGAAMALVVVAVFLQGWSPNSPLPMIGGYRFIAEGLSYEIPLAVVLIAAALPARSRLAIAPIVVSQENLWNVVRQPLGLPLYLMAGLGLAFLGPAGAT